MRQVSSTAVLLWKPCNNFSLSMNFIIGTRDLGASYSVSDNPKLKNKCRPCVLIVPLTKSSREVYFMDTQIRKKKVLVEENAMDCYGICLICMSNLLSATYLALACLDALC
jgi:hypothetical protein